MFSAYAYTARQRLLLLPLLLMRHVERVAQFRMRVEQLPVEARDDVVAVLGEDRSRRLDDVLGFLREHGRTPS
jgi:hypothetical protein